MGKNDGYTDNNTNSGKREAEPDYPVSFGYKCNWLCVKANSSEEVIEKLGLKDAKPSNWDMGMEMAYNGYRFVSPVLDGYVLVVNIGENNISTGSTEILDEMAKKFPELQYYSTNRVTDYHVWVKYADGNMVRGYGFCGDKGIVILNRGDVTPEEEKLGFTNLLPDHEKNWEDYTLPDEEYVLEIAAAWGIDPSFADKDYPKSRGYICK